MAGGGPDQTPDDPRRRGAPSSDTLRGGERGGAISPPRPNARDSGGLEVLSYLNICSSTTHIGWLSNRFHDVFLGEMVMHLITSLRPVLLGRRL